MYCLLMAKGPEATAFLSHASEDIEVVQALRTALEAQGIDAFMYESDLAYGQPIWAQVRKRVETADYVLVFLSRTVAAAEAVGREVGLALELRERRSAPVLIGVQTRELITMKIQPRHFAEGAAMGAEIDFAALRSFTEWRDEAALKEFALSLLPRVRFIRSTSDIASREQFLGSRACFMHLFPELRDRGYFDGIWTWLGENEEPDSLWRDVYGTLELNQQAVGVFYATVPLNGQYAFGNYLGLLDGSRHHGRALKLVEAGKQEILGNNANIRGIVFEAEVPDIAYLEEIAAGDQGQQLAALADQPRLRRNLRALTRLILYQRSGATTLINGEGGLIAIPTPSQQETFRTDPRGAHALLYYAFGAGSGEIETLLRFVYDRLYGEAYGEESSLGFAGYHEYVAAIRAELWEQIGGYAQLGKAAISRNLVRLRAKASSQGFDVDL